MGRLFCLMFLVCAIGLFSLPIMADVGDIVVGGEIVLRIRSDAGDQTITQRADEVMDRIRVLMLGLDPFLPEKLTIVEMNDSDTCIYYGDVLIVTVDEATARANGSTIKQLAELWVANLVRVVPGAKAVEPTE